MCDKSELTSYKPPHEQEGVNTIASRHSRSHPNPKRARTHPATPHNPTLVLMLTQEISHQFGSIRLARSARPPEVAAVHHNAIPVASRQQENSGHPGLICCAEILENQDVSPFFNSSIISRTALRKGWRSLSQIQKTSSESILKYWCERMSRTPLTPCQ